MAYESAILLILPRKGYGLHAHAHPMYGLTMMKLYLDEILSGRTDYDARLYPTDKRDTIALVDSSTFRVHGMAELVSCDEIPYEQFVEWHRIGPFTGSPIAPYHEGRPCYAYRLENVRRITVPVSIPKDPAVKMWVDIPSDTVRSFFYQTTLFRE